MRAEDDGLEAIVVGYPRRLRADDDQSAIVRELAEHCAGCRRCHCILQDERLSSREAESGSQGTSGTGASERRSWTRRRPPSSCRTSWTAVALIRTTTERSWRETDRWGFSVSLLVLILGAGIWIIPFARGDPTRAISEAETYVEIPPGTGSAGWRQAGAGGRRARTPRVSLAVWMRGSGRRLQAGEYRFDRPMTRQRWSTRSRAATSTCGRSRSGKA